MKAQDPIDGLFRDRFQDFEPEPPMHLWPGVERRLPAAFLSYRRIVVLAAVCGLFAAWLCQDNRASVNRITPMSPRQEHAPIAAITTPKAGNTAVENLSGPQETAQLHSSQEAAMPAPPDASATSESSAIPAKQKPSLKKRAPLAARSGATPAQALAPSPAETPVEGNAKPVIDQEEEAGKERRFAIMDAIGRRQTRFEPSPINDFIPGIKFLGERWYAGLDLSVSRDWMDRSLFAKNPEEERYAEARNASEAFRNANTVSLRLSLISASGISLRGGIQVAQFSETFSYTEEEKQIRLIPRLDAGGNLIGTDTITESVAVNRRQINRFHTVDIPLTLGYEFSAGKANIGLHGGPILNMAFYQEGKFLAEDGKNIIDFSSSNPDAYPAFRNRMGLGFYGSVNISHPITPSLYLFAEPYVRVFPESFTTRDYPLDQRYRTSGIFIGVRKLMGPYWMNLKP